MCKIKATYLLTYVCNYLLTYLLTHNIPIVKSITELPTLTQLNTYCYRGIVTSLDS